MESTNNNQGSSRNMWWGIGLIGLGGLFLLDRVFPGVVGDLIGAVIMGSLAVLFYGTYRRNNNKWMLLASYIPGAIAIGIVMDMMFWFNEDLSGAYWTFAVAVPFWYIYLNDRSKWWALIPGGIMTAIAAGLLISAMWAIIPVVLILAGGYMLLRHFNKSEPVSSSNGASPVKEMIPIGGAPQTGPEADK
jgi:hypothetical protein